MIKSGLKMIRSLTVLLFMSALPAWLAAQDDWPTYGHDFANTRYSALNQLNAQNVSRLAQAWIYDTRPTPSAKAPRIAQTTPLVIGDVMYFVTAHQSLVAVEPETGKQIWIYKHQHTGRPPRGIAYWPGDADHPAEILFGTGDGFLIAVNAQSGQPAAAFGNGGEVDLRVGVKDKFPQVHYGLSGAPAIYRNLVITGSHTQDSPGRGSRGDVRAWDARTGKLVWTFHSVPQPGEKGHETWLNDGWQDRSGVNAWTTFALDPQTGTIFMPFDSPSYDFYGGDRPGANLFGNSIVAADAVTGKLKWYFQTVHHDIWDYDTPGPPTLAEVVRNGRRIPVVVQSNKTGFVFILDRRSGKPVYGVEERPVPKGDVPGEWYSATQPFPLRPPALSRQSFKIEEIAKLTQEHQRYCEDLLNDSGGAHNNGPFTPMGLKPTVVFPGSLGGANWGGGAIDPTLGYYFINMRDEGQIGHMVKQSESGLPPKDGLGEDLTQNAYVRVGPHGANTGFSDPKTGWPCQQPPWGELFAINLNSGEIAWREPFGRMDDLEAKGIKNTGSLNIGGPMVTAGGLLFIGATTDGRFHAFESKTGKLLWETRLPSPGNANPITYLGKNGKQYVVEDAGDFVVAFSLP